MYLSKVKLLIAFKVLSYYILHYIILCYLFKYHSWWSKVLNLFGLHLTTQCMSVLLSTAWIIINNVKYKKTEKKEIERDVSMSCTSDALCAYSDSQCSWGLLQTWTQRDKRMVINKSFKLTWHIYSECHSHNQRGHVMNTRRSLIAFLNMLLITYECTWLL